jgi:pyruvate kinase
MIPPGWHRTKIVCTLGPATDAPGVIERLISSGMDIARVNTSHGNHEEHARRIQQVRQAAQERGQPVAILIDLPGPKFRLGELPDGCRKLLEGETIILADEDGYARVGNREEGGKYLPVRNPELLRALAAGQRVFLADGLIELSVETVVPGRAHCKTVIGGVIRSGSGINIPESNLDALVPTDEDRRHLAFALAQEAEWIGVSFVQSAADILRVRTLLPAGAQPLLMAKIEKRRALANLDEIMEASDGVMVARGDLGIETNLAEIPLVQKRIIAAANACARPVVTATQMLESMVVHEHPTRAEVTDVANAVIDGTDAVMLSAETAIGRFPVLAVEMLGRVLAATEAATRVDTRADIRTGIKGDTKGDFRAGFKAGTVGGIQASPEAGAGAGVEAHYPGWAASTRKDTDVPGPSSDAVCFAACQLAARLDARAIIAAVHTKTEAMHLARFRPQVPLVMIASSLRLYRSLALINGVAPLLLARDSLEPLAPVSQARQWLFAYGLAEPGDRAVLLYASAAEGETDSLRVVRL